MNHRLTQSSLNNNSSNFKKLPWSWSRISLKSKLVDFPGINQKGVAAIFFAFLGLIIIATGIFLPTFIRGFIKGWEEEKALKTTQQVVNSPAPSSKIANLTIDPKIDIQTISDITNGMVTNTQNLPAFRTGKITIYRVENNFSSGLVEGEGPGNSFEWIGQKTQGKWQEIATTNDNFLCSDMDKGKVPASIYGDCFETNGKLRFTPAQNAVLSPAVSNLELYSNSKYGFQFSYPAEIKQYLATDTVMRTTFSVGFDKLKLAGDNFFNIYIESENECGSNGAIPYPTWSAKDKTITKSQIVGMDAYIIEGHTDFGYFKYSCFAKNGYSYTFDSQPNAQNVDIAKKTFDTVFSTFKVQ